MHTILAVFDAGVFRPLQPVELAEGTQVEVQVPTTAGERSSDKDKLDASKVTWSDFVERTYGSCAGAGLKRPDQGELESREPIA